MSADPGSANRYVGSPVLWTDREGRHTKVKRNGVYTLVLNRAPNIYPYIHKSTLQEIRCYNN